MDKTIAWRAYKKYLHDKGYSDFSKSGNPSTTSDYPSRVERVCKAENFANLDELGENIDKVVKKYSANGECADKGTQSNGSVLNALKLFEEFYIVFDAVEN